MKSAAATTGLLSGLLLSTALAGQAGATEMGNVYLWVDKDGTPHYQDRPPEGTTAEEARALSLRYKMTDAQAVQAANREQAELDDAANLREEQQAQDQAAEAQDRARVANERKQACESARATVEKYETAHRLYKPGPDGTRAYLSDEEIDAARANARRAVAEWCGS